METIEVICRKRQLRQLTTAVKSVIKWNTGYVISFSFDDEWGNAKTLRVVNDKGEIIDDILFNGNMVELPKIYDTKYIGIGVYEGDLKSTTELILACKKSILDYDSEFIEPPSENVYNKIIEGLNSKADKDHNHDEYVSKTDIDGVFDVVETAKSMAEQSFQLASNAEEIAKGVENDVSKLADSIDDKADKTHTHSDYAKNTDIPTKLSELKNDSGYITDYTETDPTVPNWAKEPNKPAYTAEEVGALPKTTPIPSIEGLATEDFVISKINKSTPSKVSQLENDSGYLTEHQDISGKADKAKTLEGYGITDAYTKKYIDGRFNDMNIALDSIIDMQNSYMGGGSV
jgi:hypothetical protein